jgi:toxic protein SymE
MYLVQHYYTAGYVSDAKYQPLPAIILKGHCLEQAGFETGTPLEVRVLYCRTV